MDIRYLVNFNIVLCNYNSTILTHSILIGILLWSSGIFLLLSICKRKSSLSLFVDRFPPSAVHIIHPTIKKREKKQIPPQKNNAYYESKCAVMSERDNLCFIISALCRPGSLRYLIYLLLSIWRPICCPVKWAIFEYLRIVCRNVLWIMVNCNVKTFLQR